jgi:RHS repeat-associated protein
VSGTLQGAGGVGGLLRSDETIGTNATTTHYYWYDGNGNVTGLMRGNGTVDATYRYCSLCRPTAQSPFGLTSGQAVSLAPAWLGSAFGGKAESTVTPGTYAERNRHRFSTKYLDDEVETVEGTYYYGFRYYQPETGRWPSRDPIGERGGINLYGMVGNDAVNKWDYLGLLFGPKDECKIELLEDHYRTGLKPEFDGQKPGDPVCGYLGCGSNQLNSAQNAGGNGVPNMPQNNYPAPGHPGKPWGLDPNDYQPEDRVPGDIDAALEAAKAKAADMCKQGCCKTIYIYVKCGDDQAKQEKEWRKQGENKCGKKFKVPCPQK